MRVRPRERIALRLLVLLPREGTPAAFPSSCTGRLPPHPPPRLPSWPPGVGQVAAPGAPARPRPPRAPSGPHSRAHADASGPLVPRVPGRRPPRSCSSLRGPRGTSGQLSRPRVATGTARSRNGSLLRNKQRLLWSRPPIPGVKGAKAGWTLPNHYVPLISPAAEKASPSSRSGRSSYCPLDSASAGPPSV